MPKYVAHVVAVQWLGNNVTEVRQVVNASGGAITSVTVNSGTQALSLHYRPDLENMGFLPIVAPVNNWVIATKASVSTLTPAEFTDQFTLIV